MHASVMPIRFFILQSQRIAIYPLRRLENDARPTRKGWQKDEVGARDKMLLNACLPQVGNRGGARQPRYGV
jgi:hypothetical protein